MKNSFVLYTEYFEHFSLLTLEQQGLLINAIFKYQLGQELPEMDSCLKMAFSFIKAQLDRDNEKYDQICKKRSEAGKQGGRPKANDNNDNQTKANKANAFLEKQTKANKADNDNVYDNVNVDDTDTVNGNVNVNNIQADDFYSEELKYFCERFNINIDGYNGDLSNIDFSLLVKCYDESKSFLQEKPFAKNLSWICKNYKKIIANTFRDYESKPDSGGTTKISAKQTAREHTTDILKKLYNQYKEEEDNGNT